MSSNLTAGITPLAQPVERGSNKPKANRSKLLWSIFLSPVGGARFVGNPVRFRTGIGEHGISQLGAVEACLAHNQKVPGSKPGVAKGEHGNLICQYTAIHQKTLRLKIFRHCASQVRILPRV